MNNASVEPDVLTAQSVDKGLRIRSLFARQRDRLAHALVMLGATPNLLTVSGSLLTVAAGACLIAGAGDAPVWESGRAPTRVSWWPFLSALLLTFALALDVLDGAVARLGQMSTPFGALLDSTLDRVGDLALFGGCAIYFSRGGNLAGTILSFTALGNALLISYIKARAENLIEDCSVGAWQRGERSVVLLVGAFFGHIPAALWILGTVPALTVIRRLRHAHRVIHGKRVRAPRFIRIMPWRHPRGSTGYNLSAALVLGFLIAAPWVSRFFY